MLGFVGEKRRAGDVADGIDPRHVGLAGAVDDDGAALGFQRLLKMCTHWAEGSANFNTRALPPLHSHNMRAACLPSSDFLASCRGFEFEH
jgi:hypothetical protein